jgi:hypothetical protein
MAASAAAVAPAAVAPTAAGREPDPPVDGVAGEGELGVVVPVLGKLVSGVLGVVAIEVSRVGRTGARPG